MPRHGVTDPVLRDPTWRKACAYWRAEHARRTLHCARCGGVIPRRRRGERHGPWHLDVGHVVSRVQAKALGWTTKQMNALSNTQPEHAHCSRSAGGREGSSIRSRVAGFVAQQPVTSGVWA